MKILINGVPKAGNHALLKGVELLGVAGAHVDHRKYGEPISEDRQLFLKRHPRNILISMARWQQRPLKQGPLIVLMQDFYNWEPMAQYLSAFTPWLHNGVHSLSYEDLTGADWALRGIADYLNVPYLDDAFENLPGLTTTWTGAPSDWTQHWTPVMERAWEDHGMADVQHEWGY